MDLICLWLGRLALASAVASMFVFGLENFVKGFVEGVRGAGKRATLERALEEYETGGKAADSPSLN